MKRLRGYISSRMMENDVPQNVQQIVIRDYCRRNGYEFLLSATEYIMRGCTMILEATLQEEIDGIAFYSIYLLPESPKKRQEVYKYIGSKELHFTAEDIVLITQHDVDKLEEMFCMRGIINK